MYLLNMAYASAKREAGKRYELLSTLFLRLALQEAKNITWHRAKNSNHCFKEPLLLIVQNPGELSLSISQSHSK